MGESQDNRAATISETAKLKVTQGTSSGDNIPRQLEYLRDIRNDIRDDIKKKTDQRSSYAVQYIIALAGILAGDITYHSTEYFSPLIESILLLSVPVISIYYTTLIMETYSVQGEQRKYLRDNVETKLKELTNLPIDDWETYLGTKDNSSISNRIYSYFSQLFFICIMWIIVLGVLILIFMTNTNQTLSAKFSVYAVYSYCITILFLAFIPRSGIIKFLRDISDYVYKLALYQYNQYKINKSIQKGRKPIQIRSSLPAILAILVYIFITLVTAAIFFALGYGFETMFSAIVHAFPQPSPDSPFYSPIIDMTLNGNIDIVMGLIGAVMGIFNALALASKIRDE